MSGYIGAVPVPEATQNRTSHTATAGQTAFAVNYTVGFIDVSLNGIKLANEDFTATNGTSVTLAVAASVNDILDTISYTAFKPADTVAASTGGTFAGNVAVTGTISTTGKVALPATLGSAGQVLTVNSGASAAAWASPAGSFASLSDTTVSSSDPTLSTNPASGVGHIWMNTTTGFMYVLKDATAGNNYWENVGLGSAPVAKLSGTGGTVTTAGGYTYHTFTSSGTFTSTGSGQINYLLVAGGGGGGGSAGGVDYPSGGGGAGGILYATTTIGSASFTVTIGAGGVQGANGSNGGDGGNTTLANNADAAYPSAIGGGGGAYSYSNQLYPGLGKDGGSGGGGGAGGTGGSGTSGQGNSGGNNPSGVAGGGGGGGAGAAGANGTSNGGAGGAGINTYSTFATATSTGDSGYYGGGGAGGPNAVAGGAGGGADSVASGVPSAAQANTGGGGAGNGATGVGSNGGSGIVIIRYPT